MKEVFEPNAKHDLVVGGETLVSKHNAKMIVLVGHQVCTPLAHSCLQILSKTLRFFGCCLRTQSLSSLHWFSTGLRSEDRLGHSLSLMCFYFRHYFVALAYLGYISHAGRPIHNLSSVLWLRGGGFCARFYDTWPRPLAPYGVKSSSTLSRKTTPKHNISTSMLVGMVFFGWYTAFHSSKHGRSS